MSAGAGMRLSKAQEKVVADDRPRIMVSAGAGSGKTRLLVAYFVRALVEGQVPADRLVAVTFTRKAAAELADRIRTELQRLGRHDLAWSLDAATIGTIHSLCRRLIKDRPLEAEIDPACSVLEAEAAALVKEEAGREAWERVVERADEAELGVLASGGDALRKEIGPLYDRLRGLGYERPQVVIPPGPPLDHARGVLVEAIDRALAAAAALGSLSLSVRNDLESLRGCLRWLKEPLSDEERATRLEETDCFFPSKKTPSMEKVFEPVRKALTGYRSALAEIRLRPFVATVNHVLAEFHAQYEARKRERGAVDFADLELRARALTAGQGAGTPRDPVLSGSWVLVDEFQDTNELQCSILDGLGAARMLMVGDRRQSIYRFRGADVEVFRKREEELASKADDDPAGVLYRLDTNYRSRPEILDFVNRLFAHPSHFGEGSQPLLRPEPEEPEQATVEDPKQGPDTMSPGVPVEVLIAERGEASDGGRPLHSIQEAEARVVAGRVRAFVSEEGRAQRDVTVLLPAHTYVDVYRRALLEAGLDVYVVRGKGYYAQEEVADVVSLLRLLVNPHDDLAMVSVLRSPLAGVTDDALYHLGRQRGKDNSSIWDVIQRGRVDALSEYDRRSLDTLTARLGELRRRVGRPGLAKLIDDAVSLCAYDLCLLGAPEGLRRFANVRKLMRMAGDFEALDGPDLAGFVTLVESMGDIGDQEGSAPTLAEGDDVVRVMTIHQAKGLEFPVVVLAGLGSDVFPGRTADIVVDEAGRAGVFLAGSKRGTYEEHDLSWGPAVDIREGDRRKGYEEDVRLLYVAMTRAQERLVLVGARPVGDKIEKSRIGRIVKALGSDCLPPEGASTAIEGLDALLASVPAPEPGLWSGLLRPRGTVLGLPAESREDRTEMPPEFLESAQPGGVPRQVSFSALAAYQRCPLRFYLESVLGLDLGPKAAPDTVLTVGLDGGADDGEGSDEVLTRGDLLLDIDEQQSGRQVGSLVHALLERLPAETGRPSTDRVRAEAEVWLNENGVRMPPADLERAIALTLAFWESEPAGLWSHPAAEREVPFFFAREGVLVSGIMDLVLRGDRSWRIVDYKTNALNGQAPAALVPRYELQATVYCLAALLAGAPAVQMDLVFLERPLEPQTRRYRPEDIDRLAGSLDAVLRPLRKGEFPAGPGDECPQCPVEAVCAAMAGG